MYGRALLLLALPMAGLVAQSTQLLVSITSSTDANYRIILSQKDSAQRTFIVGGLSKRNIPVSTAETVSLVSDDSSSRFHVEATEGNRVITSVDGAFVVIRRDSGFVSVEARNHSPLAFPPTGIRKLGAEEFVTVKPD